MAIDIDHEELITFHEVAAMFGVSPYTVAYRWAKGKVGGKSLETVKAGGIRRTSREAVKRYLSEQEPTAPVRPILSDSAREAQHRLAAIKSRKQTKGHRNNG